MVVELSQPLEKRTCAVADLAKDDEACTFLTQLMPVLAEVANLANAAVQDALASLTFLIGLRHLRRQRVLPQPNMNDTVHQ